MFMRVLFVSLLLGASVFIQVRATKTYFGELQTSHYLLIATIYFLTFFYVILLKRLKNLLKFAYAQLIIDTLVVTAIIYATGGIESIFSFLYILAIINGSIILYRKGGMIVASSSSILYGLLLDLHYYGAIHPFGAYLGPASEYQSSYIFYMILVNTAAFYLVAFLSSYPSEQARKSRVELKATQEDIVKLEALNERIIRSITSGLITLDGEHRVILFNPAAESIFGFSARTAIGHKVFDVFPFLREHLENGIGGSGRGFRMPTTFLDLPYQRSDGKDLYLRFSVSPLELTEEGHTGNILFFQDMTEIKKIEEEMKKVEGLAMVGELAAGIAHEIRNPMASISGSIQMLKEGLAIDDVHGRLMEIILREIERLDNLVNDFLLFARPKPANLQQVDLKQLIMDSLALFENSGQCAEKIKVATDFHGPVTIETDPEQIRQVLWNLFLNASEAMPRGGALHVGTGVVDTSRNSTDPGHKTVKITIRDTGEGFKQEVLTNLFTPFFTTKQGGSGLGLATVKRIIEGLRGEIIGRNHDEGGAEISILLHTSHTQSPTQEAVRLQHPA
ncbi:MAG: PAS domain S-box protein [Deltaproteobacteria bacterium]|nr:PAS domain S-box protein [Deltaproteobacteria bacterium]